MHPLSNIRKLYWWIAIVVVSLACLMPMLYLVEQSADYDSYQIFFELARVKGIAIFDSTRFEPVFTALVLLVSQLTNSDLFIFLFIASFGYLIKIYAIRDISGAKFSTVLIALFYIFRIAPLHEWTQIRIALSMAFWMLAIVQARMRLSWIWAALGLLSHYSTLIALPVFLLWRYRQQREDQYIKHELFIWLVLFAFYGAVSIFIMNYLAQLGGIFAALDMYEQQGFGLRQVNLFSMASVVDYLFISFGFLMLSRLSISSRFWLLVQLNAIFIFILLRAYPVLAHRIHEMLNVFWVFYIAYAVRQGSLPKYHAFVFSLCCIAIYIYLNFIGDNALFKISHLFGT